MTGTRKMPKSAAGSGSKDVPTPVIVVEETVSGGGEHGGQSAGSSAIFAPVQHPILRSIDPKEVAVFLQERERYEDEVTEKKKEVPTMTVASYKVSFDRSLLRTLHGLGCLEESAPEVEFAELTSEHIELYIKSIVTVSSKDVSPEMIEDALRGVKMPMSVVDPKARVLQCIHSIFMRLDSFGCSDFKDVNPKKTIALIQERVFPQHLKTAMKKQLEYIVAA